MRVMLNPNLNSTEGRVLTCPESLYDRYMQNKYIYPAIVLSGAFLLISALVPLILPLPAGYAVSARQAAQAVTPVPPNTVWTGNFVVKAGLPFVWLRVSPLSDASVVATAYPTQVLMAASAPNGQTQVWDGMQWWGFVTVPAVAISGWGEGASLEAGPTPTPTATMAPEMVASWGISTAVSVRRAGPPLWVAQKPCPP